MAGQERIRYRVDDKVRVDNRNSDGSTPLIPSYSATIERVIDSYYVRLRDDRGDRSWVRS